MKLISIEPTPNPNSMKLNLDQSLPKGVSHTYKAANRNECPDHIEKLLNVRGVKSLFHMADFIAVQRDPRIDWQGILAGYQNRGPSPAMSAEAGFSRMLLGRKLTDAQRSELSGYLLREGRQKNNYYCWYYASMTMLQLGGKTWDKWNPTMRDYLVKTQRRGAADDGSWPANGKYANHNGGGKIYTTAMATLTLEVYYRYLPMFGGKEGNVGQQP